MADNKTTKKTKRGDGYLYRPKYAPTGMTYPEAKALGVLRESPTWHFRIYHRGKPMRWNTEQTTWSGAVKFRNGKLAALGAGRPVGPDIEKTTLGDLNTMLLNDYKMHGRKSLARIEDAIGHVIDH